MLASKDMEESGSDSRVFTEDGPVLLGFGEGGGGKVEAGEQRWVGVYLCGGFVGGVSVRDRLRRRMLAVEGAIGDADQGREVQWCLILRC